MVRRADAGVCGVGSRGSMRDGGGEGRSVVKAEWGRFGPNDEDGGMEESVSWHLSARIVTLAFSDGVFFSRGLIIGVVMVTNLGLFLGPWRLFALGNAWECLGGLLD